MNVKNFGVKYRAVTIDSAPWSNTPIVIQNLVKNTVSTTNKYEKIEQMTTTA